MYVASSKQPVRASAVCLVKRKCNKTGRIQLSRGVFKFVYSDAQTSRNMGFQRSCTRAETASRGCLDPSRLSQLQLTVSSFKSRTVGVMESHTLQENKIVRLCNAHRCLPFYLLSRRLNTCWLIVQLQEMSLVSQLEHLFDCVICMKPCHSSQQMFIFLPWKSGSSNMWGVLFPSSVCCMWTTDLIHSSQGKPSTSLLLWCCTSLNETELGE